ncbi:hypothetical protein CC79DRAFT_1321329 [Sarocladium strictum]
MKTATVAILASCLLGQALAAPVHANGAELPAKAGDLTKDIKIDDLRSALKDIAQEARAVRYGTPAKRGDDKVKDVLSALGIDGKDLDKKTLKMVEKGIKDLTDASKTPLTRLTDLSNMVQVLQPYYKKATVSKRSTKEVDTLLGNLGVDAKDLDKKTLKKVEDKVKEVADKTADPIVRAGGLGDILSILGPLLAGAQEQTKGVTDTAAGLAGGAANTATGLAGGAAGNVAGNLPTGNLPVKRLVDGSILKNLFNILGLEVGDGEEGEDGVKDVAGDVTGKAGGLLDSVTKNLPGGIGGALPIKRSSDLGPLMDLLKSLGLDGTLKGVTDKAGGAVGDATDKLPLPKRQLDGLTGLLSGLLGIGGDDPVDTATDTASGVTDAAGPLLGGVTGAVPGLGKRQLDGLTGLLEGLLGGGEDEDPVEGVTDTVGSTVGGLTGAAGGLKSGAVPGLGKRQLDGLVGLLEGLLGGGKDKADSAVDTVGSTVGGLTGTAGGLASGATGALPGLGKRQLDGLTGLLGGLLGGGEDEDPVQGATDAVGSTVGGLTGTAGGLKPGLTGAVPGLGKRQLEALTGLLGGGKGGNPLDTLTGTAGGLVDTVGSTADSLTGGATAPLTSTAGGLADTATGLASGATGGLGKRQLDDVTGLLGGLTGGGKGGNPLDAVTGTAGGLVDTVGSTADSLTGGATAPLTSTAGGLADTATGLASGAAGAVPGLGKRQLDAVTGVLGGLTGGSKGGNPLDAVTGTAGGLVDTVGSTADSLTGGATAPLTSTAGGLADTATGLASGAAGAVPGLGKRMVPGSPDLAALLQALGPVIEQLKGAGEGATGAASGVASGVTDAVDEVAPIPTPAAAPKGKRQAIPGAPVGVPAPEDIMPADLPTEGTEPLTVIFDDLSEVSMLLPQVGEAVPEVDALRETIDKFLASLGSMVPEGAAPEAPLPIETPPVALP